MQVNMNLIQAQLYSTQTHEKRVRFRVVLTNCLKLCHPYSMIDHFLLRIHIMTYSSKLILEQWSSLVHFDGGFMGFISYFLGGELEPTKNTHQKENWNFLN